MFALQAHFSRAELPISDYITDLKSILDQSIRIIQAMIDVCANSGWLSSALTCMHLLQMIIQVNAVDSDFLSFWWSVVGWQLGSVQKDNTVPVSEFQIGFFFMNWTSILFYQGLWFERDSSLLMLPSMNDNLLDHLKGRGVSTVLSLLDRSREELHKLLQPFSAAELYQVLLWTSIALPLEEHSYGRTFVSLAILDICWNIWLAVTYLYSHL